MFILLISEQLISFIYIALISVDYISYIFDQYEQNNHNR